MHPTGDLKNIVDRCEAKHRSLGHFDHVLVPSGGVSYWLVRARTATHTIERTGQVMTP